jgi:hypothetical protein
VLDAHQDLALGGAIDGKFVGDEHTRDIETAFEQFAEELFRRLLVAPTLD